MMVKHLPFKKSLMTALLIAFSFLGSPALKAEANKTEQAAMAVTKNQQVSVVNINQAGLSKLQDLKGIGPAKAQMQQKRKVCTFLFTAYLIQQSGSDTQTTITLDDTTCEIIIFNNILNRVRYFIRLTQTLHRNH